MEYFKHTTLGYIEWNNCYLMLYRNKKDSDPNQGKWLGVGGHLEKGETPDACFVREVQEETGIQLDSFCKRGEILFISDSADCEIMHLYTAQVDSSDFKLCNEGTLQWIPKERVLNLNLWEGDKFFLEPLVAGEENIKMVLIYSGDRLDRVVKG